MAQYIIKDLPSITEGLQEINIEMKEALHPQIGNKQRFVSDDDQLKHFSKNTSMIVEDTFGIQLSGKFMIGDKVMKIQGEIIEIDGEMYMRTPGLCALIAGRNPKEYLFKDYEQYKELLYGRDVLHHDYNPPSSYHRRNKSKKWTKVHCQMRRTIIAPC